MKYGFVKVRALSPSLKVGDVRYNSEQIIQSIHSAMLDGVEVAVFPELCLCGYTCGDLLMQSSLLQACVNELAHIARATEEGKILAFVGLPLLLQGKLYNVAAAFSSGKLIGFVPKTHIPNYGEFYEMRYFSPAPDARFEIEIPRLGSVPFGRDLLFVDREQPEIKVGVEICEDLWVSTPPSSFLADAGAVIICNLSASNEIVGKREYRKKLLAAQSGRCICAYAYADANMGESTSDAVFSGNHLIYENGVLLSEATPFSMDSATAEVDTGYLLYERRRMNTFSGQAVCTSVPCSFMGKGELTMRDMPMLPFVPAGEELALRAETILSIQANALARRMQHTGAKTAVIGISGGLDSALAFLVIVRAFDILKKRREDIIAITMPGFGTTLKTKNNSLSLMNALGATIRTINIGGTISKHFKDIDHDPELKNTTYENAQARYRTMILMDIANETGGLVIGTGDLSELALGWCTYNGDHMSMYAVNCSVPKTLVKSLVHYESERMGGRAEIVLKSILNTEISPELLPPDEKGEIVQRTEDIIGPYELHDFFLYRMTRCGDSPKKLYYVARYAFKGKYNAETIKKWLIQFYRRFFSQQFKRNCVPDGVKVGSVSLSPRADWRMPADAASTIFTSEFYEED